MTTRQNFNPFLIDCDTGRDDALTLWLAHQMGLPLIGVVTSYGNVPLQQVVDNTARILSLIGRTEIPIWAGATDPTRKHRLFSVLVEPRQRNTGNGLCNLEFPAASYDLPESSSFEALAEAIASKAKEHGPVDYFIIGPATNFCGILRALGSRAKEVFRCVTMMGGKFAPMWKADPIPDFNIACDPFALQEIISGPIPLRLVPINATWPIAISLEELERLVPQTPLAVHAQRLMIAHSRHFSPEPLFRFHDPSVLLAAQQTQGFRSVCLTIECDETKDTFGRLMEDPNGNVVSVYDTTQQTIDLFKSTILSKLGLN